MADGTTENIAVENSEINKGAEKSANIINNALSNGSAALKNVGELQIDKYEHMVAEQLDVLQNKLLNGGKGIVTNFTDDTINKAIGAVDQKLEDIGIPKEAREVFSKASKSLFSTVANFLTETLGTALSKAANAIKEVAGTVAEFGKKVLNSICDFFRGDKTLEQVKQDTKIAFKNGANLAVEQIKNNAKEASQDIKIHAQKAQKGSKETINEATSEATKYTETKASKVVGKFTKQLEEARIGKDSIIRKSAPSGRS
jgi:uncharacterized protein (UPF0147 family)